MHVGQIVNLELSCQQTPEKKSTSFFCTEIKRGRSPFLSGVMTLVENLTSCSDRSHDSCHTEFSAPRVPHFTRWDFLFVPKNPVIVIIRMETSADLIHTADQ